MKQLTLFSVNLQQGFLTLDTTIVAAYSHFKKEIVFRIPFGSKDIQALNWELPGVLKDYSQINRATDGFSINMWTDAGYEAI
jgi:hypothetical protein